jgi:hypothetical protein
MHVIASFNAVSGSVISRHGVVNAAGGRALPPIETGG